MSFSTFELPIRKLIKLVVIVGGTGALLGITTFTLIAWQAGMFKPDAFSILGSAIWIFHASYPALFAVYAIFITGIVLIFWLDRRHQKAQKYRRYSQPLEVTQ